MDDSTRKRITWLGLAIATLGLGLGFLPMSEGPASCGSAFAGGGDAAARDFASAMAGWPGGMTDYAGACDSTLQTWRIVAIILIGVGLAVALVFNARKKKSGDQHSARPRQPSAP